MLQPKEAFIRAYALEMLIDVNNERFINKEKLFGDAMAYYRWQFSDERAMESVSTYYHEFMAHHESLVKHLNLPVRSACFVTWFVEQGFHRLPPLGTFDPEDELLKSKRFSSPSFCLPTGEPTETFLIQWVHWRLDNPLPSDAEPDYDQFALWSRDMMKTIPDSYMGDRSVLPKLAARFFHWGCFTLRTWEEFVKLLTRFFHYDLALGNSIHADACWDAHFLAWFCQYDLDHPDGDQDGMCAAPIH